MVTHASSLNHKYKCQLFTWNASIVLICQKNATALGNFDIGLRPLVEPGSHQRRMSKIYFNYSKHIKVAFEEGELFYSIIIVACGWAIQLILIRGHIMYNTNGKCRNRNALFFQL